MRKKSKSAEAEDRELAAQIAKAHSFNAFLFIGPRERYRSIGFPTYEEARGMGDLLEKEHPHPSRRAIIYAVNKLGSFACTPELIELARQIKEPA